MAATTDFAKMVPGFDFMQGLIKNAGAGMPNISQWIAPTLDPAELDKRIDELRAVQFWLEQNARMLAATIQALEVQRMTLSTLKTMNMPMTELRKALEIKPPAPAPAESPKPARKPKAKADPAPAAASATVDPMQWWGALTKQFTELATNALKETGAEAAKTIASPLVKQAIDAATQTPKKPAAAPAKAAARAAGPRPRSTG